MCATELSLCLAAGIKALLLDAADFFVDLYYFFGERQNPKKNFENSWGERAEIIRALSNLKFSNCFEILF